MNVSFEQIDAVNAVVTVDIKREDFANDVVKEVAKMGVRHPLKGFRPGKAPKSFGENVCYVTIEDLLKMAGGRGMGTWVCLPLAAAFDLITGEVEE